jgi:hypothetical protein
MSLIINKKIPMFKKGYPTMSDKYNVAGGILTGEVPVKFGSVVILSGEPGYFKAPEGISDVKDIGGIVVATNVKLAQNWPGTEVQVNPGEAFNLLVNGFIAVEMASVAGVVANAPVAVTAAGAFTSVTSGNFTLPNTVFTGLYEQQPDGSYLAEIYVK